MAGFFNFNEVIPMEVCINGQSRDLAGPTNIQSLLDELGYRNGFVVVALNRQCIPRQQFHQQLINERDEIEILAPMAGG